MKHPTLTLAALGALLVLTGCGAPSPKQARPAASALKLQAEGPWAVQPTSPLARTGTAGSVLAGRLHIVGGVPAFGLVSGAHEVLSAGDAWEQAPALPLALQQAAAAAGPDGRLYVAGGKGADGALRASAYRYDPTARRWEALPALGQARSDADAAADDEYVYVVGGWNGRPSGTFEALQLSTLTWRSLAPLPLPRAGVVAQVADRRLFVAGGHTKAGPTDRLDIYDLQRREWLPGVPMPTSRTQAAAVMWANELYVLGGRDLRGPLATVERYNPALNAWSRLPDLPQPVADPVAGVVWQPGVGETLVITGGSVAGAPSGRTWGWPLRRPSAGRRG